MGCTTSQELAEQQDFMCCDDRLHGANLKPFKSAVYQRKHDTGCHANTAKVGSWHADRASCNELVQRPQQLSLWCMGNIICWHYHLDLSDGCIYDCPDDTFGGFWCGLTASVHLALATAYRTRTLLRTYFLKA